MMLAQITNTSVGNWVLVAALIVSGFSSMGGLVAFFATRREVQSIDERVKTTEAAVVAIRAEMKDDKEDLIANGERRSTSLHRRLDPLVENTAALKAGQEAYVHALTNFTQTVTALAKK